MIEYTHKTNSRSRRLRLAVRPDGKVIVTSAPFVSKSIISDFISSNQNWIENKLNHFKNFKPLIQDSRASYLKHKESARKIAHEKVRHFNNFYNFKFNNISIKNQKTCWGSCSKKGNLNFNYKIALLPQELSDYIVAHEICHLKEFNHSKNFWDLLAKTIPDYQNRRNELKKVGVILQ